MCDCRIDASTDRSYTVFFSYKDSIERKCGKSKGNRKALLLRFTEIPINCQYIEKLEYSLYDVVCVCDIQPAFAFCSHCFSLINMAIVNDDNIEWPSWNRPSGTVSCFFRASCAALVCVFHIHLRNLNIMRLTFITLTWRSICGQYIYTSNPLYAKIFKQFRLN